MRIDDWPLDRIMQLPDCAFGRRWPVSVAWPLANPGILYDISEEALPEWCVVWELLLVTMSHGTNGLISINLALGDVLPTTDAEFDANEAFLRGLGWWTALRYNIVAGIGQEPALRRLRHFVHSMGRRVIGRCGSGATGSDAFLTLVVSSVPKEVPDWLVGGQAK